MTPREAFTAGDAYGRESLTEALRNDEQATKAAESSDARKAVEERLSAIERSLSSVQTEQRDGAGVVREALKRLAAVEVEVRHLTEDGR